MITDLAARRAYWNEPTNRAPRDEHDLTDSLPYPFEGHEWRFYHQCVLEIGPGRGRQYERLRGTTSSYVVCDISPAALLEPVFAGVPKYLLCDYRDDFVGRFNIAHFWYVLHHVKSEELGDFFAFVARHLRLGGLALFNSPQSTNTPEWYTEDGVGTTWMDVNKVRETYTPHLETVGVYNQNSRSSGDLFVVRKR